jgi:hypothetical protein
VSDNRVLKRICGPKREEVAGSWRRMDNEELHKLYVSPNIIRHRIKEDEMGETPSKHGET